MTTKVTIEVAHKPVSIITTGLNGEVVSSIKLMPSTCQSTYTTYVHSGQSVLVREEETTTDEQNHWLSLHRATER